MGLIVQKFGGSSVADAAKIKNVARRITDTYKNGNDVIVVLSAQGDTTDDLRDKAREINPNPSRREMDMLLSTGEQVSVALVAMAIEAMGYPVISLTAWQAGITSDQNHTNAKILEITGERVRSEIGRRNIVLITGFQGVNKYGDITTLGRGASDTTAVALAARFQADICQIFTDVEGVYTADPRLVPEARKLDEIPFDDMMELATLGAQVLHNRSVEMAKRYGVKLEVLSSLTDKPGTMVKEVVNMESPNISGVAKDDNVASISLVGLKDQPGVAYRIFSLLSEERIDVDIILQSIGRDNTKDITFTVKSDNLETVHKIMTANQAAFGFKEITTNDNVTKVSIVGSGMVDNPGIAANMFKALAQVGINIHMISTSEIKVSVLIDKADAPIAVKAIHRQFFAH